MNPWKAFVIRFAIGTAAWFATIWWCGFVRTLAINVCVQTLAGLYMEQRWPTDDDD